MRQRVRESKKEGDNRGEWAREIDKMRKINRERESEKQSWRELDRKRRRGLSSISVCLKC